MARLLAAALGPALLLSAALVPVQARAAAMTETQKIEALIKQVEGLKDAKFVRNGSEYDAKTAAKFLRRKWEANKADIQTAEDFIEKAASVSSTSGKPYLIRFQDGTETKSGDYFHAQLKKLEKP
jgi:hypothetical protein